MNLRRAYKCFDRAQFGSKATGGKSCSFRAADARFAKGPSSDTSMRGSSFPIRSSAPRRQAKGEPGR